MTNSDTKRVLIIKLGAIGDIVMSLSMLEAIKEKYGGAEIVWISGKASAPILNSLSEIKHLFVIDDSALLKGNLISRLKVLMTVWKKLFLKRFDLIVIPYRDKRYRLLALTARGEVQRDFMGKDHLNSIIPGRYHGDEYRKLIDGKDDRQMKHAVLPKIKLSNNDKTDALIEGSTHPRIILAPGGSKNLLADDMLRRWPVEYYKELCLRLTESGMNVILIGADTDKWVEDEFKELLENNSGIINLIGKTSILDLISLFDRSDILVTHDTGSLQMAKLSSVTPIALFGPVNPKERIGENENVRVLWGGRTLACSPCYDGKNFAKCDNNICMKDISVDSVLQLINETINKNIQVQ
ncbi:MAG: glycosyltransferase family 9 protein [Bacillota bacterium]